MMAKFLQVKMNSDNTIWAIPAEVIAASRAAYYAKVDADAGDGVYNDLYPNEYEYSLSDDSELIDWARQNMNWADVKDHAVKIEFTPEPLYDVDWVNADVEVVER